MTQQEYEQKKRECWEEFRTHVICGTDNPKGFFERAFDRAYALGKQEKDADTVIQGWVARDENGRIFLYEDKPERENGKPYGKPSEWISESLITELCVASFPDLTWESEPEPVEIIIKRKKNG